MRPDAIVEESLGVVFIGVVDDRLSKVGDADERADVRRHPAFCLDITPTTTEQRRLGPPVVAPRVWARPRPTPITIIVMIPTALI